ncbi:MAG: OmpA family protein [bacterium]
MKKNSILILALTIFLGNAVTSNAQFQRSKLGAGVLMGGSQLKGDIKKSNTNLTGGLILRYTPIRFFSLTATSTYGQMTSGLNAFKTDVIKGSLSGTLFLFPTKKYSPLLTFGLSGLHFVTMDGNNRKLFRLDGSPIAGWERAFQLGLGMEFFVGERWAINTTADYYFTQGDDIDAINQGKNDDFFQGLIGVLHYFKKPKKFNKENGKYGNKLMANADVEKIDTKEDISDSNEYDQTLIKKNTVSYKQAQKFGEDAKSKLITTQDSQNEMTNFNESEQLKSSTDTRVQKSESLKNEEMFSNGIYFEPGSAKILKKSKYQLQKIYKYLLEYPEAEIELQGFKGEQNTKAFDTKLAYERAKAVKTYLVNLGIKPSRIVINTQK